MNERICRHYNGLLGPGLKEDHKPCGRGLNPRQDYCHPGDGHGIRFACVGHKEAPTCPEYDPFTPEEVAADKKEIDELVAKTLKARTAIMNAVGNRVGVTGTVPCPCCQGGTLAYRVSGFNGHVWGMCSTKGCVKWME